jgi:hypothetical protein
MTNGVGFVRAESQQKIADPRHTFFFLNNITFRQKVLA